MNGATAMGYRDAAGTARRCPFQGEVESPPPGMAVRLTLPKTTFAPGEPVSMKLTVKNESDHTIEGIDAGYETDFWVQRDEQTVWLWSLERGGTMPFSRRHDFAPGEEETHEAVWKQTVCGDDQGTIDRGEYRAFGVRQGPSKWWAAEPVSFKIQ
jgi:Intracellular proteinase inhibitor